MGSQGSFGQSKEFLDLVKSIGEARSKAEEDRIILHEIEILKRRITEPDIHKWKMKEYILRLFYVEMLGHDASFGYIHAVKMTHDDNLTLKRTGYLAMTLFLNEDHDLIILIVNTIQKDLRSDNFLVVCTALNAVCKLINEETIPAVLPQIVELLGHPKEVVRKKAVMALHRFHSKSSWSVSHLTPNFCKRLCDNDTGVMGAALCPLYDLISANPSSYKDLVISFVSILKQIIEHRLPKTYDYHHLPAPFIQIKLLKILALLGSDDRKASEQMYTILADVFRKCDSSSNIGNAVLYECVCCISSICSNRKLVEAAANIISKFLKSDCHNLKYLGIDALGRLMKLNPEIAESHQFAVIDCLEDPDDTLKRKTFELLYKMTKSTNVEVIVDRMIDYMITITDDHYKAEIASRCINLAEQYAPGNQWFIQTVNKVFVHAGDFLSTKIAHSFMRLIADGFVENDDDANCQLRTYAVESYMNLNGEAKLPSLFLQVICWVLGEYGTADGKFSASHVTGKLCDVAEAYSSDETVKAYAVTALMKIYAFEIDKGRKPELLPECLSLVEALSASHSTDLQQRAYELQAVLSLDKNAVKHVLPQDRCYKDLEVETRLSFLDGYVQSSLEKGANPYLPESQRSGLAIISAYRSENQQMATNHALRFEAYELPKPMVPHISPPHASVQLSTDLEHEMPLVVPSPDPSGSGQPELKLRLDGVQRKWGNPVASSPVQPVAAATTRPLAAPQKSVDHQPYTSEIPAEKQRLAASIFGGKPNTKQGPRSLRKAPDQAQGSAELQPGPERETPVSPPADLLDLGETDVVPQSDPFQQLEQLLDAREPNPSLGLVPGVMTLFNAGGVEESNAGDNAPLTSAAAPFTKGGPNHKDSIEKDAIVRQMGVVPSLQNPNLFKDLLG